MSDENNNDQNNGNNGARGDNPFGPRNEDALTPPRRENRPFDDDALDGVYAYNPEREGYRGRRVSVRAILLVVLLLTLAIVWYAYPRGADRYADAEVPLIRADSRPYKTAPEDRGGMEVPHQDSTVFESFDGTAEGRPAVETLLPAPEQPIDRDALAVVEEEPAPQVEADAALPAASGLNLDRQLSDARNDTTERAQLIRVPEDAPGVEDPAPAEEPPVQADDFVSVPETPAATPAAPAVSAAPETATAAGGTHYVQLGAFRDQDSARREYSQRKSQYDGLIDKYAVKYEWADLGERGIFYRIKLGPMSDAEARSTCEKIKAINPGGCLVAR